MSKQVSKRVKRFLGSAMTNQRHLFGVIKGHTSGSNPWRKYSGHYGGAELRSAKWMVKAGLAVKESLESHIHYPGGGKTDHYTEYGFRLTEAGIALAKELGVD